MILGYKSRYVWHMCPSSIPVYTGGKLLPLLYGPGLLSLEVCVVQVLLDVALRRPFWPGSFCQCFSVLAQSVAQLASCGSGCTGEIRTFTDCAGVSQWGLFCNSFGVIRRRLVAFPCLLLLFILHFYWCNKHKNVLILSILHKKCPLSLISSLNLNYIYFKFHLNLFCFTFILF